MDEQKKIRILRMIDILLFDDNDADKFSEEYLDSKIKFISDRFECNLSPEEFEEIRRHLHHQYSIIMNDGWVISEDADYEDWYSNGPLTDSYWGRYKRYLLDDVGFSDSVVNAIDSSTSSIVNLLGNPKKNISFAKKGLVIGDVQSGKTANYISVINKAADAGYKVIVLLTGTIEKLRKQTQARVDEGFIGDNTSDLERNVGRRSLIGVGRKDPSRTAVALTSTIKDFNKTTLINSNIRLDSISSPLILVVKKNKTVLDRVYKYFKRETTDAIDSKINHSLLFIDDEADNASINTNSSDNSPTAINQYIRKILSLFARSSYVGYTATPYANVFIEPSNGADMYNADLFPRDYIYVLDSPSNYIGAREIYSANGKYKSMYREIDDFEQYLPLKHKKDVEVPYELPLSLKKAILSFFIINAIRDLRGNITSHRSMLVNVSRFIAIQNELSDRINIFISNVKNVIQNYILLPSYNQYPLLQLLYDVYNSEFILPGKYKENSEINWEIIKKQLIQSIENIKVESINGGNASRLLDYKVYEKGLRIIAVGGLSLSRGLTLEGLCVSYFYRNSVMYDTLMQMGRWFGYRHNYEDICQVWMSGESYSWYQHISDATDELRDEIRRCINDKKYKPIDVGIKVRSSEGALIVTARNKMRSAGDYEVDISLNGNYIETPYFSRSQQSIDGNVIQVKEFLEFLKIKGYELANPEAESLHNKSAKQILRVKKDYIVEFLKNIDTHSKNIKFDARQIAKLLEESTDELLDSWDIAIAQGKSKRKFDIFDKEISVTERTAANICRDTIALNSRRLGSPGVVSSGLTEKEYEAFFKLLADSDPKTDYSEVTIPDSRFFDLGFKRRPLLVIYLIDLKSSENITQDQPLVGLALGIPKLREPKALSYKYKVNVKWLQKYYDIDDDMLSEVDDLGEDDD